MERTSDFEHEGGPFDKQQILRLQIHVTDIVVAQVPERQRELLQKLSTDVLGQLVLSFDEIRQIATVAILHHDIDMPIYKCTRLYLYIYIYIHPLPLNCDPL